MENAPFVNQTQLRYILSHDGKPRSTNLIVGMENRGELPPHVPAGSQKLWNKRQLSEKLRMSIEDINETIKRIPSK